MLQNWLWIRWPVGYTKARVDRQRTQLNFNWISIWLIYVQKQTNFIFHFLSGVAFIPKKKILEIVWNLWEVTSFSTMLLELLWERARNYEFYFFLGSITSMVSLDYNFWNTKMACDFIILCHLAISLCVTLCLPYIEWETPGINNLDVI